ncbi:MULTISPECIES: putative metalloprotease CJM1_0395 family protein [Nitrospirillum]|uniref:SprA family protein n=1 Tax=Nitrospirillum amazonense TaxID=28077 RepID=A0A560GCR9_9PROT|nr:putative metalloprotease CJM1_0395 family protein [Nitrospirillum amazonense]MEC4595218.1 putative metalloprotease CJM1_0395 family protein [Nitrospirillum amazonense]TWB31713.1 SprA family protein [Nitrospirillum amazonense]
MSALGGISASPVWARALTGPTPAVAAVGQGAAVSATSPSGQAPNPYSVRGQVQAKQSGGAQAAGNGTASDGTKLSDAQQQQVDKLKTVDRAVRAHEAAHKAAGGPYAGSESFTFTTGPDGQHYATAGEVAIDIGSIQGDPQATITKLETVRRAALAPADPSGQDRAVAAQAQAGIVAAQGEEAKQKTQADGGTPNSGTTNGDAAASGGASDSGRSAGAEAGRVGAGGVTIRQGAAAYRKSQGALDASIVQAAQAAAAQPLALIA